MKDAKPKPHLLESPMKKLEMDIVTLTDGIPTTTTLAIAEGTGNDHASVIKLVRAYQADLSEFDPDGLVRFEIRPRQEGQHGGGEVEYAVLNEDQSLLLFTYMRNTDIVRQFKKSLVKAFRFLVNKLNSPRDPMETLNDPVALRGALLIYTEKVLTLESKVGELSPKANALDRFATCTDGTLCLIESAKALQLRPKDLVVWLKAHKWIYKRPGAKHWLGYQDRVQAGLLEHKVTTVSRSDGSEKVVEQVLVTAKGLAQLSSSLTAAV